MENVLRIIIEELDEKFDLHIKKNYFSPFLCGKDNVLLR